MGHLPMTTLLNKVALFPPPPLILNTPGSKGGDSEALHLLWQNFDGINLDQSSSKNHSRSEFLSAMSRKHCWYHSIPTSGSSILSALPFMAFPEPCEWYRYSTQGPCLGLPSHFISAIWWVAYVNLLINFHPLQKGISSLKKVVEIGIYNWWVSLAFIIP